MPDDRTKDRSAEPTGVSPRWLRVTSRLVRIGAGLLMLLAALGIFGWLVSTRPVPPRTPGEDAVLSVETIELRPVEVDRVWTGHGAARAVREVTVPAEVSGRVESRLGTIEEGVFVRPGTVLVTIERDDFIERVEQSEQRLASLLAQRDGLERERVRAREQLDAIEGEVEVARREVERARDAEERGAGNQTDVDQRLAVLRRAEGALAQQRQLNDLIPTRLASLEAQIQGERADLRVARRNLSRATITAPFSGFVQEVMVEEGEWLSPGTPVARIVDLSVLEVPLQVPASASASVAVGDRAEIGVDGLLSLTVEGAVDRIAPVVDDATRSLTVFAEVRQPEATPGARGDAQRPDLLPGQYVVGRVFTSSGERRLIVPRRAVLDDRVLVVETETTEGVEIHRVRGVPVQVAYHIEGSFPDLDPRESQWAVLEGDGLAGLGAGTRVVISNLDELNAGRRVEPVVVSGSGPSAERGS